MTRKIVALTVLVLALPLAAVADGGVASSIVNLITTLPEPSTLGLLGSGLIGFAVVIRRKLKLP
jgi:PEP-CTERM motif-containing protein